MDDSNDPLPGADPPTLPLRPVRRRAAGRAREPDRISDADRLSLRRFGVPLRARYRRFDTDPPPPESPYAEREQRSIPQWAGRADHYPASWSPRRAADGSYEHSAETFAHGAESLPHGTENTARRAENTARRAENAGPGAETTTRGAETAGRTPEHTTHDTENAAHSSADAGRGAHTAAHRDSASPPRPGGGRHRRRAAPRHGLASVVRDIVLVTFGKYGQYAITVITLPLIARILGPHGVGLLAIGMSSYFIGSLVVDLGVTQFLAARVHEADTSPGEVNRLRGTYAALRVTTVSVIGAALLASLLVGAPPALHMVLLGLFTGGFWSLSEDWLLIGQGRFGSSTIYQGVGRIGYLILLLVLLPQFPSASTAIVCLLVSSVPTVALTWWDSMRHFGRPARPSGVRAVLRLAAPVFTSRLLVTGYGQGSAAIYGAILSAASLGLYSAGDRLVRAIQSTLDPIGFALLPRMARRTDREDFWRTSIQALAGCVAIAIVATVTVWVSAPWLIHLVFGQEFADAVPLLRFEVLILPATTVTSYVTTAVLTVRQDTTGVLVGAIVGTCVAVAAMAVATRTQSVWTLVYGTVFAEISVAVWYIIRMRWLIVRERTMRRGAVGPATVLMRKGETA